VSCLGHSDEKVKQAIRDQLDAIPFAHTGFFTSEAAERMAAKLIENAPGDLSRVYPLSGGSECMEAALKLARQYFLEIGQPKRHKLIARRQSYHGNTLGALATGGNAWRREKYAPMLIETHHISPCYPYREQRDDESAEAYGLRAANELEEMIQKLGPDEVLAFVAEPVVGATAGALAPVPGYFKRIREICDEHGVLLILDEVMCGMGRTGTLFACEQDGVAPDITAIAKGLGAGYASIGAMMCTDKIYDAIAQGSGAFEHGHTYHAHPLAAAAAHAVLTRLVDDGLVERAAKMGEVLQARLVEKLGQHAHVGDIRGRGMFRGIELVEDRETKTPFDRSRKVAMKAKKAAMEERLVCYPASGTVDGQRGDHILLAPPFIISEDEIDMLVTRVTNAIDKAVAH
jgi:adenosylmethionine-8-amino-7-oxononanoate aminotransferase